MKDEQQYNEFIRELVKNNEDLHYSGIELNKEEVWERMEARMEKKKVIPLWLYSVAASIILLIGLSFIFNQNLTNKNIEIARLEAELEFLDSKLTNIDALNYKGVKLIDTVKIVNEKIVYLPVKSYEKVIVHDTITNLVKVTDTVFIKEEKKVQLASNEKKNIIENQTIITNTETKNRKKNRRFVFLFGKPKDDSYHSEAERLITLKTK